MRSGNKMDLSLQDKVSKREIGCCNLSDAETLEVGTG